VSDTHFEAVTDDEREAEARTGLVKELGWSTDLVTPQPGE
jgi:hypothetical protein